MYFPPYLYFAEFRFFCLYYSYTVSVTIDCTFPLQPFDHTIRYIVIPWLFPSIAPFYHTIFITLFFPGCSRQFHPSTILYTLEPCLLPEFLSVPDASGLGALLLGVKHVMPVGHGNGLRMPPRSLPPRSLRLRILSRRILPPRTLPPRTPSPRTPSPRTPSPRILPSRALLPGFRPLGILPPGTPPPETLPLGTLPLESLPLGIRFRFCPRPPRSIQMSIPTRGDGLTPLLWETIMLLRL